MTLAHSSQPTSVSHSKSLVLILVVCLVCLGLAIAVGFGVGGQAMAAQAGAGMLAAAVGGLVAWAVVAFLVGPNSAVMAVPMLGLMVRLFVTAAGVGFLVMGFGFEKRPVLFAALFGYLVLMATETILLYRFASSSRPVERPMPAESANQD